MGYRVAEPFELLVRLRERLVGAAPLGEIAGHLGIPDEAALRVPHRIDHAIGPEARAVLAHAPPFVLVTALALRDLQCPLRLALRHIVRGIERRVVLTHALVGAVPLDALRSGVPARDPPVGVEHENGAVLDALDQELERLFAPMQRVLRFLASRQVAGHLGEPDHRPLGIPPGRNDHLGPEAGAVLPHPPPFIFHSAVPRRDREQPRRLSLCHGLRRVKAREMLPYDLLRPVPLDALRPGIPGGDATRAIQHEDRDVLDVLDQLSEGLRGFAGDGNGGHYALRQHDDKYARAYISCKPLATACPRRGAATLEANVEDQSWSCANTCPSPRTPHSGSEGKPAISSSAAPRTGSARRWHTRPSAACWHTSAAAATWSSSTQGSPDSSCASPSVGWTSATGRALRCAPAPASIGTRSCKTWCSAAGQGSSACRAFRARSAARRYRTWAPTGKRSPRAW